MSPTSIDVTTHRRLTHGEAVDLQATELERTLDLLGSLDPADWDAPTDCPDWDVRLMYLHVLGACESSVSLRENAHQMLAARKHRRTHGGPLEAGLSHVQIADRRHVGSEDLVERLRDLAPTTVRKRSALPSVVRAARLRIDGPVVETWTLGYLVGTIYLRDLWMHRVDAAVATGRDLHLTPDHDGVIVADVVGEWAARHGRPVVLRLTGPAGGDFRSDGTAPDGTPEAPIELDAVEFCRTLAGRRPAAHPLLETIVPF